MISSLGAALWILWGATDPCAPLPSPGAEVDAEQAEVYRSVGDAERAAGQNQTAAVAYREALRLNPALASALGGWTQACQQSPTLPTDPLTEGIRLMKAGERSAAIAQFQRARQGSDTPAASLLEGICHYELGEDPQARPLLEAALGDDQLRSTAQLFLGLIQLRRGDSARATAYFQSAQADPSVGTVAQELNRLAYREGRLTLSAFFQGGYDSNVDLTPDGTRLSTGPQDAVAEAAGALLFRPLGASGPFLRLNGLYRNLLRTNQYDLGTGGGAAGWQLGANPRHLRLSYGYDFLALGNNPYLSAQRLQADGRATWGNLSAGLAYLLRWENYLSLTTAPYSGLRQEALADAGWSLHPRFRLGVSYRGARDSVTTSELSWLEHGPGLELRWSLSPTLRLAAEGGLTLRAYDTFDTALGVNRQDSYWDGAVSGEWDLSPELALRLCLGGRKAQSNVPDFNYTKLTATLGLSYSLGVL